MEPARESDGDYVKFVKKVFKPAKGEKSAQSGADRPDPIPIPAASGLASLIEDEFRQRSSQGVHFDKSALAAAASKGYQDIVRMLIGKGAAGLGQGAEGRQALVAALEKDHLECLELIYQALGDPGQAQSEGAARPGPAELEQLAGYIYENNLMSFASSSFILPPADELVKIIAARLALYPAVCLGLLSRLRSVSSSFVYSILSGIDQMMHSRPEPLDRYLEQANEEGEDENELMFDELWEARQELTREALAANRPGRRDDRPLGQILMDLDQEMDKLDSRLAGLFNPGLSQAELAAWGSRLKYPLTDDLMELYSWHNGLAAFEYSPLLRGNYFMPLKEALIESRQMAARGIVPGHILMFTHHGWGWLDIDLGPDPGCRGLVCQVVTDAQDRPTVYSGLKAFFGALLAVFRQDCFGLETQAGPRAKTCLPVAETKLTEFLIPTA